MIVDFTIDHAGWKKVPGLRKLVRRALDATLPQDVSAISLLFSGDEEVQRLNARWRGKDKPTNILSFPASKDAMTPPGEALTLGDLVLSYETIVTEAQTQGKTLEDHMTHLLVHGALHLLGYDHEQDEEAELMELREIAILSRLGLENPYGDHE